MFHIVCFLVVEWLLYHIIYSFYTIIVILASFEIPIFSCCTQATICCAKGSPEITRICIQDLETITSMNMHANWLLDPPVVRLRGFFPKTILTPANPSFQEFGQMEDAMHPLGVESFSQCERPPLAWSGPGEATTRVGAKAPYGSQLVPKFAQMCNIIHPLVINNQEYKFMTSNDSPICYNDRILCLLGIFFLCSMVEYHRSKMCSLHTWLLMPPSVGEGHPLTSCIDYKLFTYLHTEDWPGGIGLSSPCSLC